MRDILIFQYEFLKFWKKRNVTIAVHEVAATIFQCSSIKSVLVSTETQAAFVIGFEKIFSFLRELWQQAMIGPSHVWKEKISVIWDLICRLKISLSDGTWAYFLLLKISFKFLAIACNFIFWSTVKSKIFFVSIFSIKGL